MSKFFNETRKAQDWGSQQTRLGKPDLSRVMDSIREPLGLVNTSKEDTLRGCRKIRLPESSESPALYARNDFTNIAAEAYRTLRTRLLRLQAERGLRSVAISSAVPGEGKTLTALNLALCCAQLPQMRVLLVDGDLRTSGLTTLLGRLPSPGLGEILTGEVSYGAAVLATEVPNFYVLGVGSSAAPASGLYQGDRWKDFVGWCTENFDLILVDSPPMLPLADFEQISAACDGVLIIVRANHVQKESLQKASKLIDAKKLVGLVLNASPLDKKNGGYSYYAGYGSKG